MTNVSGYIDAPIVYDPQSMAQVALNNLMTAIPGWSPREGNLDVLLVEEFAQMASEAASAASSVPSSIFKYYGSLVGIPQNVGVNATIQTQWSLIAATSSFTIPAGTIAGFYWQGTPYQYQTLTDVTFTSPTVTQTIVMEALNAGYNYGIDGLGVPGTIYLTTSPTNPYLANITVTGTPGTNTSLTAGVDAETDSSYLNRLAFELALLAPRPITPNDYASMAQNVPPAYRAAAIDGINPYGNLLTSNDANLTTAITNNYLAVGNGTATRPTLSLTGGTLQVTAATMPSATTSTAAVTTSSTSIAVTTAILDTTVSASNPAIVLVSDTATMTATTTLGSATVTSSTAPVIGQLFTGPGIPSGTTVLSVGSGTFVISQNATSATAGGTFTYGFGNEIVVITSFVVGTGNKTWNLQSGTKFTLPHASGVTLTLLQGAIVPNVSAVSPNTAWLQATAVVKAVTETSATARPFVVSVATYYDGSVRTFSSQLPLSDSLYDYTTISKTVFCNIAAFGGGTLAPSNITYASLTANLTSVQSYIVWQGATGGKTHTVTYSALQPSIGDLTPLTGRESILYPGSDGNYIPDPNLIAYASSSAIGSSWTLDAGLNALPGIGVQIIGTGSAIGSALNAKSQAFNMPNIAGTSFTAYASVDTTYATAGTVTLNVMQVGNTTPLWSASTSGYGVNNLVVNFSIPATSGTTAYDIYTQIVFNPTLNVSKSSSVTVSNIGLIIGNYTTYQSITTFGPDALYYWTAGGQYIPNVFNYARIVAIAPVTSTGFPLSVQQAENVTTYLDARREVNFNVYAIQPNYVPINVSWSAVCLPGFDPTAVQAAGNAAISSLLSPANWAGGLNTPPYWDTTRTTVRVLDVAGTLSQVQGIATVSNVLLSAGVTIGTLASTDIAMLGLAPLPVANYVTGSVITNGTNSTIGGI